MKKFQNLFNHLKFDFLIVLIITIIFIIFIISVFIIIKKQDKKVIIDSNITAKAVTNIVEEPIETIEKEIIINDSIKDTLLKYNDFNSLIFNANINVPLENSFIPQGITYYNDYLLIVGYYENGNNSKCYILDFDGNIVNVVELDTNSHVGAITYDSINELLWIPDNNGILNAYSASEFVYANSVNCLYKIDYVSDGLDDYIYYNKKNIAFVTIDDNYIYIGNFFKTKKCLVKKYLIKNEDTLKLEYVDQFLVPPRTQSISFIDFNNEKYMVFSNSFNRRTTSYLETYKYDENVDDYNDLNIKRISMPPMSEQVTVKDEYAFIIFESGANKYYNALDKIKYICILDINKLLE